MRFGHHTRILAVLVIIALAGLWSLYDWLFVTAGPAYFAADWRRAMLVAAVSIFGGLVVFAVMNLPEASRRWVIRSVFAGLVIVALAGCCVSIWGFFQLREVAPPGAMLFLRIVAGIYLGLCLLIGGAGIWYLRLTWRVGGDAGQANHSRQATAAPPPRRPSSMI